MVEWIVTTGSSSSQLLVEVDDGEEGDAVWEEDVVVVVEAPIDDAGDAGPLLEIPFSIVTTSGVKFKFVSINGYYFD